MFALLLYLITNIIIAIIRRFANKINQVWLAAIDETITYRNIVIEYSDGRFPLPVLIAMAHIDKKNSANSMNLHNLTTKHRTQNPLFDA